MIAKRAIRICIGNLDKEFGVTLKEKLKKFVFKIHNNRGVVVSEFIRLKIKMYKIFTLNLLYLLEQCKNFF